MMRWLLLVLLACQKPRDPNVIMIGEVGALTGAEATFGTRARDGIELAIRQANEAGGVKGRKLAVRVYDDQGKAEEATAAIMKLITQDRVVAVLGEVSSTRTIAMAPIAQSNRVPLIASSATNVKVTQMGEYVFRACFIDPFQGRVMATFAANTLHAKTAAILRDSKSDYSLGLGDAFAASFEGKVIKNEMYTGGDVHFKSQLTGIRAAKPDVLFVPGYYTEAGLIIRQAREVGFTGPILGGDGWDSPSLIEIGGAAAEGAYFSNGYSEELDTPAVRSFVNGYKAAFGYAPDSNAASGYDSALILIDGLKRATDDTGPALQQALAATRDLEGVTGKITIDAQRNAQKAAVVIKVADKRFRYVETVRP